MGSILQRVRDLTAQHRHLFVRAGLAALTLVAALAFVLALWGDRITMAMWNNFHILPEVVTYFNPDNAELALSIGYYQFNTFGRSSYDLDEAERWIYRSLELDPMVRSAWHQLARIDFLKGNLGAALAKENRQLALHGDSFPSAYYIRGLIYAFAGRLDEAEEDFLTYLSIREKSWAGHNDLAWVYFRQGEYEKALEHAELGLRYAEHNPWLLTMKGTALINLGREDEAREPLERALAGVRELTREDWVTAYPGNDPAIAEQGLAELTATIESNLGLVD